MLEAGKVTTNSDASVSSRSQSKKAASVVTGLAKRGIMAKLLKVEPEKEGVAGKEKKERQERARASSRRGKKAVRRLTNGHKAQDFLKRLEKTNGLITGDNEEDQQLLQHEGDKEEYFDISRMTTEQRCFLLRHFGIMWLAPFCHVSNRNLGDGVKHSAWKSLH